MAGKGNISAYLKVKSTRFIRSIKKTPAYKENIHVFCESGSKGEELIGILKKLPHIALLSDPFGWRKGSINPYLNLGKRPYIPKEIDWDEAKKEFIHLLSGARLNADILSDTSLKQFVKAKQLVVKVGNGNALLPWLTQKLCFSTPPIYWVRHPIPTCLEQLDKGADPSADEWENSRSEFADYWEKHQSFIQQLNSPLERQLAKWCLHNLPALEASQPSQFIRVCYEDFLRNGRLELHRIFGRLAIPISSQLLNGVYTQPDSAIGKWRYKISKTEKERAQRVLDYFSIDLYSAYSPYPIRKEEEKASLTEEELTPRNYPICSKPV